MTPKRFYELTGEYPAWEMALEELDAAAEELDAKMKVFEENVRNTVHPLFQSR